MTDKFAVCGFGRVMAFLSICSRRRILPLVFGDDEDVHP
jgi:hypothetical protein